MEKLKRYQDLIAWKKAHQLVLETYRVTQNFPSDEKFGLVSQMRRASVSVASCIVEGFNRQTPKDKKNFYTMALASGEELRYQFFLSSELGFIERKVYEGLDMLFDEVGRLLNGLKRSF